MIMEQTEEDTLYVRMFGEFSVTWNGKRIAGGGGNSGDTQFAGLLQLLIHNRGSGVARERLEELFFAGRSVQDRSHAMRTIIYNARKRLRAFCQPDAEYIRKKAGVYIWTGEVPVVEDAREMDLFAGQAEEQEDPDMRLEHYLKACYLYTGEFLGARAGVPWAEKEARRYRDLFCRCVEQAAELLRKQKDYERMEALGAHAMKVQPMADWETVKMEALAASGRIPEARQFYDETVSAYYQEQGARPSRRLTELLRRMGDQMDHPWAVFDEIEEKLAEDSGSGPGGYVCPYPVFEGIYRTAVRALERNGQSVYLMLCTVVDGKGNPVQEGAVLDQMSKRLCDAVRYSVRRSDVVNQYGRGQCLVLLTNTTRESCRILQKRINSRFRTGRQRIRLQYHVKSVLRTPETEQQIMN